MSPTAPTRAPLLHAASFTYGTEQYPASGVTSISSERSTVGLGQTGDSVQPQWPPKSSHDDVPLNDAQPISTQASTMMLPPIRNAEPQANHYYYPSYPSYPYGSYQTHAPLPQYPPQVQPYKQPPYMVHHQSQFGYSYPAHPGATTSGSEIYSHSSAYVSGTIQPSAVGGWSHDGRQRGSTSTADTVAAPEELEERRDSVQSNGLDNDEGNWEKQSPLASVSDDSDSDKTFKPVQKSKSKKIKSKVVLDHREGNVTYTTDCELKRMCFNCDSKAPPSWRKSVLNPGRILCNKCGIFERTHHRARPPQNDENKLRKNGPAVLYHRREAPPPLPLVMRNGTQSQSPISPYSSVPSQSTPINAEYSFPHYSHISMPPPSGSSYYGGVTAPTSHLSHRRHSQTHVYAQQASSPYAYAYSHSRRSTSQHATTSFSVSKDVPVTAPVGGSMQLQYWDDGSRRHSDAVIHPPTFLLSSSESAPASNENEQSQASSPE